jgi:hypothetical protein
MEQTMQSLCFHEFLHSVEGSQAINMLIGKCILSWKVISTMEDNRSRIYKELEKRSEFLLGNEQSTL